jgi:hypothetical protein
VELDSPPEGIIFGVSPCVAILICGEDTEIRLKLEDAIHSKATLALVETLVGFDYEKVREAIQRLDLGRRRMDVVWIDLSQSEDKALALLTKLIITFEGLAFFVSGTNVEEGTGIRVQQAGCYWLGDDLTQVVKAILWRHKLNSERSHLS